MRRALLLVLFCSACTSWQRQSVPVAADAPLQSREARITRSDGAVYTLRGAYVEGDSLVGFTAADSTRVAIATAEIRAVETREFAAGRTVGLTAGVLLGLVAVVGIAAAVALSSLLGG